MAVVIDLAFLSLSSACALNQAAKWHYTYQDSRLVMLCKMQVKFSLKRNLICVK